MPSRASRWVRPAPSRTPRASWRRERFFALNGDVLTDIDLTALAAWHVEKRAMGTIYLTPVEDPRRYGLVRLRADGSISDFLEKPGAEFAGPALINAGVYVLEPEVLEMIPAGRMFSIERGVFPLLAQAGSLFGHATADYWRDIGTPESYLAAHFDVLEQHRAHGRGRADGRRLPVRGAHAPAWRAGARVVPPAFIDEGAVVRRARPGRTARRGGRRLARRRRRPRHRIGPAGRRQSWRRTSRSMHSVIVRHSVVGAGSELDHAIVGEGCRIGAGNRLMKGISLSAGTVLPDGSVAFRDLDEGGEGR